MHRKLILTLIVLISSLFSLFATRDGVYSLSLGYNYVRYRTDDIANNNISFQLFKDSFYEQGSFGLSYGVTINDMLFYTHRNINSAYKPYNTALSVNFSLMPVFRYKIEEVYFYSALGLSSGIDFIYFKTKSFKAELNVASTFNIGFNIPIYKAFSLRMGNMISMPFYRHDFLHPSNSGFDIYLISITPYVALGFNFTDGFSWN